MDKHATAQTATAHNLRLAGIHECVSQTLPCHLKRVQIVKKLYCQIITANQVNTTSIYNKFYYFLGRTPDSESLEEAATPAKDQTPKNKPEKVSSQILVKL